MIERHEILQLIEAARIAGRHDFARTLAADWLAHWPGDHPVVLLLAQTEVETGLNRPASARLTALVTADPEFVEAYDLLATALRAAGDPVHAQVYSACASALRAETVSSSRAPCWSQPLSLAVRDLNAGDPAAACLHAQQAMVADPDLPLPLLVALRARIASDEKDAAAALARVGHNRWPECVAFDLVLANDLLSRGKIACGVEHLHRAAAADPLHRIAARYLGTDHPYQPLWPSSMTADLEVQVPAEVAAVLGKNRLPSPTRGTGEQPIIVEDRAIATAFPQDPTAQSPESDLLPEPEPWEAFRGPNAIEDGTENEPQPPSDAVREARLELEYIAQRLKLTPRITGFDRRAPAYIVASCRTRLVQEFGEAGFRRIDDAILALVETVRRHRGWSAYRIYLDDPQSLKSFRIPPAEPLNAWQLKLRLADLDRALGRRGEMIAALLIVGGARIVPFHTLPNPTDDDDDVVPSDNPYASTDENYFAPEWAVGRLPSDDNPDLLVRLLRNAIEDHRAALRPVGPAERLRRWLASRLAGLLGHRSSALGYSASIWRKASLAVFRAIGDPAGLFTSPPIEAHTLPSTVTCHVGLSYFNLHGLEDAPEWFGHRDPLVDTDAGVDYPVALRPQDIANSGRAPRVVFTEACYGANIAGKTPETAICLKFLASGSRVLVGSTKLSYGALTPPLIGADLLGRFFWENLRNGHPAGEALRRAKLSLATEMVRRQGYLDGEDQKTLISFVLYGDPLHRINATSQRRLDKNLIRRPLLRSELAPHSTPGGSSLSPDDLDPATLQTVKSVVARYLPAMSDADCRVWKQDPSRSLSHASSTPHPAENDNRPAVVVTLAKSVQAGERRHPHLARLTLDPTGRVLKLVVSR